MSLSIKRTPLHPPGLAFPKIAQPPEPGLVPPPEPVSTRKAPPSSESAETIQKKYRQLSQAAIELNTASDQLAKPIQAWEAGLGRLNLGVPAWVDICSGNGDEFWWDRSVGYTKLKDRWGIALRTRSGDHLEPLENSEEVWAFNDAPRWMRIEGVSKLPDLLDALLRQAEDTIRKLKAKLVQASDLADAISKVADEMAPLTEQS